MSQLDYAAEKYSDAVDSLATGRGRIKERLMGAAIAVHTVAGWVPEEDWEGVKTDINRLWQRMTARTAVADEGDFAASIEAMTEDQAVEIASLYMNILAKLISLRSERDRQL